MSLELPCRVDVDSLDLIHRESHLLSMDADGCLSSPPFQHQQRCHKENKKQRHCLNQHTEKTWLHTLPELIDGVRDPSDRRIDACNPANSTPSLQDLFARDPPAFDLDGLDLPTEDLFLLQMDVHLLGLLLAHYILLTVERPIPFKLTQ